MRVLLQGPDAGQSAFAGNGRLDGQPLVDDERIVAEPAFEGCKRIQRFRRVGKAVGEDGQRLREIRHVVGGFEGGAQ